MKRLFPFAGALLVSAGLLLHADTADDLFVQHYNALMDAESLLDRGEETGALIRFRDAENGFKQLKAAYPSYNPAVIDFRINYVGKKIAPLAAKYPDVKPLPARPSVRPPSAPAVAGPKAPVAPAAPVFADSEITRLHDQIISLQTDKLMLQKQLKDALAAKPAAIDPQQLARAEARVAELQKEADLLKVSLAQEQKRAAGLVEPGKVAETQKLLTEANRQLGEQKRAIAGLTDDKAALEKRLSTMRESRELPQLKEENSALKRQMADLSRRAEAAGKTEAEKKSLEAALAATKEENRSLKAENAKMGDAAKLEAANRLLATDNAALKGQVEALKAESRKLAGMSKLEEGNRALTAEVAALKRENESLNDAAKKAPQLAKLEAEARALKQENANLSTQLKGEQAKVSRLMAASGSDDAKRDLAKASAQAESARTAAAQTELKLAALQQELRSQAEQTEKLRRDNQKLEALLLDPTVELGGAPSAGKDGARIKQLERERDELEKRLRESTGRGARRDDPKADKLAAELSEVKARLEVLEAKKTPYSKEELALFKAPSTPAPAASRPSDPQQLSASARPLMAEGQRAFAERRFDVAADKYEQVVKANGDNVFALANLASAQLEQNKLRDAERNLEKALAVKGDDAYSLSLLGIVRFRQGKFDEALSLLSRSATLDPTSADTQNFLGVALSQSGQRAAAEAALRKSIQLAPSNPAAHHNLAVIYAAQNPPMLELARWHYQKARSFGHAPNEDLEKVLNR